MNNINKQIQKEEEIFNLLKNNTDGSFLSKLFEPFMEIENRSLRFAVYLFKKQVLNISKIRFERIKYVFFYCLNLLKLKILSKFRKIRVGFWVTEEAKWVNSLLYEELKNDSHFEPFILLGNFSKPQGNDPVEHYKKTRDFFKKNGMKIYNTYDTVKNEFKDLNKFKADIIFYQQPWMIPDSQKPDKTYKKSLLCYVPYCFYSMDSYVNYLAKFQGIMWKYFVETNFHKNEYEKLYEAKNCIVSGSAKLDAYHSINKEKTDDKKRIIYAPHHSFNDGIHEVATFRENGKFILELAEQYSDIEWIFRPHPLFIDRILKNSIMTEDEIKDYYDKWDKIGKISTEGNYYEMFYRSDALITDCISFLSEYAPTLKPVFHLRKDYQKDRFNNIVNKLDEGYYQIYSNGELEETFKKVIIQGDDYLKEKRKENKIVLPQDSLAGKNIYEYIKKELNIK